MKKLFTLSLLMLCTAAALHAQDERKVWDFRKGFSQATIDNLTAAAAEGNGWTNQYNAETGIGYFESKARTAGPLTCKVDGEDWVIPETEGLTIGAVSNQHFNVVIGHKTLDPHIWLNGKKAEDYVTVPKIPAGEKVWVIYSSHKDSEARGFKVSDPFKDENGKQQWTNKGVDTVCVVNTSDEVKDLKMQATNGMHFHLIAVGSMPTDEPIATKVAYLYDSTYPDYNAEDDFVASYVGENLSGRAPGFSLTPIDMSVQTGMTRQDLEAYNSVIVGPIVAGTDAARLVRSAVAYTPMLNLSPMLYGQWGVGQPIETTEKEVVVSQKYRGNALFNDELGNTLLSDDGTLPFIDEGTVTAYMAPEGTYFGSDDVIATTADGQTVAHVHNAQRNAYMMLPFVYGTYPVESTANVLLNAVLQLTQTKAEVTPCAKPQIKEEYKDLQTVVTLTCSTKSSTIYYTLDGTEPTEESTVYDGTPFTFTATATVKAIAIADGYNLSDAVSRDISIHRLAKTPQVFVDQEEGKAVVSLMAEDEGAEIYFNFIGSKAVESSQRYTEPFELTFNATLTAFVAELGELLQSELAEQAITVQGYQERPKVLSTFRGSDHNIGNTLKSGFAYYTDEVLETNVYQDVNGVDSVVNVYATADSIYYVNNGKGWQAVTKGQPMIYTSATVTHNVGDFGGYNPESVFDDAGSQQEISNNAFQFAAVNHNNGDGIKDPASAYIQTTEALQAPFDVVGYVGGKNARVDVYVSADTLNADGWTKIGQLVGGSKEGKDSNGKDGSNRIWRKTTLHNDATGKMFVRAASDGRLANLFTVLVKGQDEENAVAEAVAEGRVVRTEFYGLNGMRLSGPVKGITIVKQTYANGAVKTQKVLMK